MSQSAAPSPRRDLAERRSERTAIDAEVALRRSGQHNFRVRAYDLSPLGCQIEFVERPHLRECVWIKFDGLEALEAQVCWVKDFRTGVLFRSAIHPAVFELLLKRLGGGAIR